jgi:hypothetical protein
MQAKKQPSTKQVDCRQESCQAGKNYHYCNMQLFWTGCLIMTFAFPFAEHTAVETGIGTIASRVSLLSRHKSIMAFILREIQFSYAKEVFNMSTFPKLA